MRDPVYVQSKAEISLNALSCPYDLKLKIPVRNWAEAPSVISTL